MLEVIKKDLLLMLRERTFVSIVFLLLFIASISSVVTFGLLLLYNPEYVGYTGKAKVAVVGECFLPGECVDSDKAMEMFSRGEVDAVVFVTKIGNKTYVDILVPEDEIKAIQVMTSLKKELVNYEQKLREKAGLPVSKFSFYSKIGKIDPPSGASMVFKFMYLILIPLMSVTTAIVAAGLTIDTICEEIQSRAVEVLLSTPLSPFRVSVSKIATPLIFSTALTFLWLVLLGINGVEISRPVEVFVLSTSISALFISIAYAMSVHFKDRERSQLYFSILAAGSLPLLVTKYFSPAVMVGRAAAGAEFDVTIAAIFAVLSFSLLLLLPFLFRIDQ